MAILKCKMCGGDIELSEDKTFGTCDSCGSTMTFPKISDEQRADSFNRGNHFRRIGEFDKALQVYERIVQETPTDAEAHWCCALCRFGIEYVEDPATYEYIPTCHRASFDAFTEDVDYLAAVENADGVTKKQYIKDGAKIAEVQRGILKTSQNEKPFDVFICYKESDENGGRTVDSTLAQDIYYQLTDEGLRVFFARITLEDKIGSEYEPYIFAALNSAKAMVVVGTKPEHFNAVWVKNEWSRYLSIVKHDRKKVILPCYKDMDPYELPEQLSVLQSYDMSKIGFIQDLIRGIKKITADTNKETVKETGVVNNANTNTAPLLERVFLFLEDGKWQDANIYCEKVLDIAPKNAEAYLGKLMAELQVTNRKKLADCAEPFDDRDNYSKVLRFGDEALEKEMRGYITHINDRNENTRLEKIYNNAINEMNSADCEGGFHIVARTFKKISGYKDADLMQEKCYEKAEICRKNSTYEHGCKCLSSNQINVLDNGIRYFESISGWKDADDKVLACQKKIEEIKAKEEADRLEAEHKAEERRIAAEKAAKKRKKAFAIGTPIVAACIAFLIVLTTVIIPTANRNKAYDIYGDVLNTAKVGDTITFGKYEQDNNTSNGKENIEWIVLAKENGKILVISKYALDCQSYNTTETNVTWETCSLRKWLNVTFMNDAFDSPEKEIIAKETVSAHKNPKYSTNPGNSTNDKVFLLSIREAEKYFSSDSARQCSATAYAKAQGAYTSTINGNCWWWLRSPGAYQFDAALVYSDDSVSYYGYGVSNGDDCVRPALWIDLGN